MRIFELKISFRMFRPYRAFVLLFSFPQGVALDWYVKPLWGYFIPGTRFSEES